MQGWLGDYDILIYSTHNEGKSVVPEKFIKTLKDKVYKKFMSSDSKSYLCFLNKLLDKYNNAYHHSIGKKNLLRLIILLSPKKLNRVIKLLNSKLVIESGLLRNWLDNITKWPMITMGNIFSYVLQHKDFNTDYVGKYKDQKAYSYFDSGFVGPVLVYQPKLAEKKKIIYVYCKVTGSQHGLECFRTREITILVKSCDQ